MIEIFHYLTKCLSLLFALFLISRKNVNTEVSKARMFIIFLDWMVSLEAQFHPMILPNPLYLPLPILFLNLEIYTLSFSFLFSERFY